MRALEPEKATLPEASDTDKQVLKATEISEAADQ
jgi:hypothetical protein